MSVFKVSNIDEPKKIGRLFGKSTKRTRDPNRQCSSRLCSRSPRCRCKAWQFIAQVPTLMDQWLEKLFSKNSFIIKYKL